MMNFEESLLTKNILIVDDDYALNQSRKAVLLSKGFLNISSAYSIGEAIDIFYQIKLNLLY